MASFLESRKTGERYPYNADLARHPDMFVTNEHGDEPIEPAPPEPEMVRPAAPPNPQFVPVTAAGPIDPLNGEF